jgi:Fe-S-cluster containining protein
MEMKKYLENTRFQCLENCINCCNMSCGYVLLTSAECKAAAIFLETDTANFITWFTRTIDDHICLKDGIDELCIFLVDNLCMIYPVRPAQCRTYPFWPENIRTAADWEYTKTICPGIGLGRKIDSQTILKVLKGKSLDSDR